MVNTSLFRAQLHSWSNTGTVGTGRWTASFSLVPPVEAVFCLFLFCLLCQSENDSILVLWTSGRVTPEVCRCGSAQYLQHNNTMESSYYTELSIKICTSNVEIPIQNILAHLSSIGISPLPINMPCLHMMYPVLHTENKTPM